MPFFDIFKLKIKKIIFSLKEIKSVIRLSAKDLYRIEEININKKKAIIYCLRTRTILKLSLIDVICDQKIICNLFSAHAAMIGYYLGKTYKQSINFFENGANSFLLKFENSQYKILSQNRDRSITFINIKTKCVITNTPINIYQNQNFRIGKNQRAIKILH